MLLSLQNLTRARRILFTESTGLSIDDADGQPGAQIKDYWYKLGSEGIINNYKNSNATITSTIQFHMHGQVMHTINATLKGRIAMNYRPGGLGWDSCFIPNLLNTAYSAYNGQTLRDLEIFGIKSEISHKHISYNELRQHIHNIFYVQCEYKWNNLQFTDSIAQPADVNIASLRHHFKHLQGLTWDDIKGRAITWERMNNVRELQLAETWNKQQIHEYVMNNNIDATMTQEIFTTLPRNLRFSEKQTIMEGILQQMHINLTTDLWNRYVQHLHNLEEDDGAEYIRINMFNGKTITNDTDDKNTITNHYNNPMHQKREPTKFPIFEDLDNLVEHYNEKEEYNFKSDIIETPQRDNKDRRLYAKFLNQAPLNAKSHNGNLNKSENIFTMQTVEFDNSDDDQDEIKKLTTNEPTIQNSSQSSNPLQIILDQMQQFNSAQTDHLNRIDSRLATQTDDILAKVESKQETFRADIISTIDDKIDKGNKQLSDQILTRVELLEEEQKKQTRHFERLLLESSPNQRLNQRTLTNSSNSNLLIENNTENDLSTLTTRSPSRAIDVSSNNNVKHTTIQWDDLEQFEDSKGWQEDYLALTAKAEKENGGQLSLPKLNRKIERGIKYETQRMTEGDEYPPEPVRSIENQFFAQVFEIKESKIVGDDNLGLFAKQKILPDTTFHYHGIVHFPTDDEHESETSHTLSIHNGRVHINASPKWKNLTPYYTSMINENIWDVKGNNIKFVCKKPDNGRMIVKSVVIQGIELFVQYDANNDYDWTHVKAFRALCALQQSLEILTTEKSIIGHNTTKALQSSIDIMKRFPIHFKHQYKHKYSNAIEMIRKSDGFIDEGEVKDFMEYLSIGPNDQSSKLEYQQAFQYIKHAIHIAFEEPYEQQHIYQEEIAFEKTVFPHQLLQMKEFQLEHGFISFREPYRTKRDTTYFVKILHTMRKVGTYIPNYSQDERMFPTDTWTAKNQTKTLRQTESLRHFTRRNIQSYVDMDDDPTDPKDETYGDEVVPASEIDNAKRRAIAKYQIPLLREELRHLIETPSTNGIIMEKRRRLSNDIMEKIAELEVIIKTTSHIGKQAENEDQKMENRNNDSTIYTTHNNPKGGYAIPPVPQTKFKIKQEPGIIFLDNEYPHHELLQQDDTSTITPNYPAMRLTNDQQGIANYTWEALQDTTFIANSYISNADYFKGVKNPYNLNMMAHRNNKSQYNGWQQKYNQKFDPSVSEIHDVLNRLRDYCLADYKTLHDFGVQIYNGILFDHKQHLFKQFERLRELKAKQFTEPDAIPRDDLQQVCKWIERMYKEILKKWRVPITADAALEWLQNVKMNANDFTELDQLIDNIRKYASHLDTNGTGIANNESSILKYIYRALRQTDMDFGTPSGHTQSLENKFRYQHNIWTKAGMATEEEQANSLEQTCTVFRLQQSPSDAGKSMKNVQNYSRRSNYRSDRNTFNPTLRNNAYNERVENYKEEEELRAYENQKSERDYGHSVRSSSPYSGSQKSDYIQEYDQEEMEAWHEYIEIFSSDNIRQHEYDLLTENDIMVDTKLGTGTPYSGGLQRQPRKGQRCKACGDDRHDLEHCYSATSDGNLSLASLALLDVKESDRKLETARRLGCSLENQPDNVIETVRDIIARLRKNLTNEDRNKNIQNIRDAKARKKSGMTSSPPNKSTSKTP
jgi:inosine/xanthosine triphosphate pyrophosphatase family protein